MPALISVAMVEPRALTWNEGAKGVRVRGRACGRARVCGKSAVQVSQFDLTECRPYVHSNAVRGIVERTLK